MTPKRKTFASPLALSLAGRWEATVTQRILGKTAADTEKDARRSDKGTPPKLALVFSVLRLCCSTENRRFQESPNRDTLGGK